MLKFLRPCWRDLAPGNSLSYSHRCTELQSRTGAEFRGFSCSNTWDLVPFEYRLVENQTSLLSAVSVLLQFSLNCGACHLSNVWSRLGNKTTSLGKAVGLQASLELEEETGEGWPETFRHTRTRHFLYFWASSRLLWESSYRYRKGFSFGFSVPCQYFS